MGFGDESMEEVEKSPNGHYVRFNRRIGSGAYKNVYMAYDTETGKEVAWNTVDLRRLPNTEKKRITSETSILKRLKHAHIINFYDSWANPEREQICFTTEIVTSGTLKEYVSRISKVKLKILKNWLRQILEGLCYLHTHEPPIIHRDLKCDNIFINGSTGEIRIGDFGLSATRNTTHVASVLGTPEFMAPELYDESYTEKVDIYAFGMCVLELVTNEYPYQECRNAAQIWKRVSAGIKPLALQRIKDVEVRAFCDLCLAPAAERLSAAELLQHPFLSLQQSDPRENMPVELYPPVVEADAGTSAGSGTVAPAPRAQVQVQVPAVIVEGADEEPPRVSSVSVIVVDDSGPDHNVSTLSMQITFTDAGKKQVKFDFDLTADTPPEIASEMVEALALPEPEATARKISDTITETVDGLRRHLSGVADAQPEDGDDEQEEEEEEEEVEVEVEVQDEEQDGEAKASAESAAAAKLQRDLSRYLHSKSKYKGLAPKVLKQRIEKAGGSHDRCVEKKDLVDTLLQLSFRNHQELAKLSLRAEGASRSPSPQLSATSSVQSVSPPPVQPVQPVQPVTKASLAVDTKAGGESTAAVLSPPSLTNDGLSEGLAVPGPKHRRGSQSDFVGGSGGSASGAGDEPFKSLPAPLPQWDAVMSDADRKALEALRRQFDEDVLALDATVASSHSEVLRLDDLLRTARGAHEAAKRASDTRRSKFASDEARIHEELLSRYGAAAAATTTAAGILEAVAQKKKGTAKGQAARKKARKAASKKKAVRQNTAPAAEMQQQQPQHGGSAPGTQPNGKRPTTQRAHSATQGANSKRAAAKKEGMSLQKKLEREKEAAEAQKKIMESFEM